MVVEVIKDMGQFFFILLITILAVGHTYYIFFMNHNSCVVEEKLDEEGNPYQTVTCDQSEFNSITDALLFSYKMTFGEFSLDNFDKF